MVINSESNLEGISHSNRTNIEHSDETISEVINSLFTSTTTTDTNPTIEEEERNQLRIIKNAERLNELSRLGGNEKCGECGKKPARWASFSIGIFLCIRCSGLHRGLGTHLSKVRSLDLDDWSDEQIKNMELVGNEKAKLIWEARLPSGFRVTDQLSDFNFNSKKHTYLSNQSGFLSNQLSK
ncbi:hypothetical protein DFH28DRAFT_886077 [Melampsora americana]|nr:hypothetical protein DFH28DRAFT_886077 [Melampsora americana]